MQQQKSLDTVKDRRNDEMRFTRDMPVTSLVIGEKYSESYYWNVQMTEEK